MQSNKLLGPNRRVFMGSDLAARWRQQGKVFVWRCKNQKNTWNLSADEIGCQSLEGLFTAMRQEKWSSKVNLKVTASFRTANCFENEICNASSISFSYKPNEANGHWIFRSERKLQLLCEFGYDMIAELEQSVCSIAKGNGDFSIGNDIDRLWIWWPVPGQASQGKTS